MALETANQPLLRKDGQGNPIPAFGPVHSSTQSVSITDDAAVTLSIPANTKYYELASVIPIYVNANGTAVVTSAVFPAGVAVYKVLSGQTQISCKRVSTDTGPITLTPLA